jgi:hypothetical protein
MRKTPIVVSKVFVFGFLLFIISGCAFRHQEEIRRLQDVSREMEAQGQYVLEANQKFEALLAIIDDNSIVEVKTAQEFLDRFGEPVLVKTIDQGPLGHQVRWLYRYVDQMWGSKKVYLYFDSQGNLYQWEYRQKEQK